MMTDASRLYRSRDGMFMGVCKGIARYRGLPVLAVRIAFILLTLFTGFWPGVGLYFLAAFLLEPEPPAPSATPEESAFYRRFQNSRSGALQELETRMKRMDERLRRMEDRVTQPEFDWEARLRHERR